MYNMENQEPTNKDVLNAVSNLAGEFNNLTSKVGNIEESQSEILEAINNFANNTEQRFQNIESDLSTVKSNLSTVKSTMVTKDYLDDKLTDLRGDLVIVLRKEDTKLKTLMNVLKNKNIISEEEVKIINALEPFPQLAL